MLLVERRQRGGKGGRWCRHAPAPRRAAIRSSTGSSPSSTPLVMSYKSWPGFIRFRSKSGWMSNRCEHLVEHLPVLGGHADPDLEGRLRLQRLDQRRHLDGFGPGAENQKNFLCHLKSPCASSGGGRVLVFCKDGAWRQSLSRRKRACRRSCIHAQSALCIYACWHCVSTCQISSRHRIVVFEPCAGITADVLAGSGEERQICFYLRFINWGNHVFQLISGFAKALNHSEETHDERT